MSTEKMYKRAREWESLSRSDMRDVFPFVTLLDELLFQAELRFCDYRPAHMDGEFGVRLWKWINNLPSERHQRALFRLLEYLVFIDRGQLESLYRDAYRRIVTPWLVGRSSTPEFLLGATYTASVKSVLRGYLIASLTESWDIPTFLQVNDLSGLPKPLTFGDEATQVGTRLPVDSADLKGAIIFEDMVGTGRQAARILRALEAVAPPHWRILFTPLMILERGLIGLRETGLTRTEVEPVLVLRDELCLRQEPPSGSEPPVFKEVRALVNQTAARVLQSDGALDDPPNNPFGYEGSGGLVVTAHNAPNNSLPLLHHKAPSWNPLFRRLHHLRRST